MKLQDPEDLLAKHRGQAAPEEEEQLLPTTTISIDEKDNQGRRYAGSFLFTVPTFGQQIEIGRMKAQYLPEGARADVNAATLVDLLCYLTVCIDFTGAHKKPTWWNPLSARVAAPYLVLYGRCLDYEARFHGRIPQHRGDDGELSSEDGSHGDDPIRVGDEVQPPAKRPETLAGKRARST